ncbi:hypothetical protein [Deinococcus hohokamensis]|uniref:Uncharacterized protein n=1 Tax=Deinococcus hohokamensis TaxID=309883 RepID=A0ABV9I881_9DEIO
MPQTPEVSHKNGSGRDWPRQLAAPLAALVLLAHLAWSVHAPRPRSVLEPLCLAALARSNPEAYRRSALVFDVPPDQPPSAKANHVFVHLETLRQDQKAAQGLCTVSLGTGRLQWFAPADAAGSP